MSSAAKRVDLLVLWNDPLLSSALLAGTNRTQYLKDADSLNRKSNLLDVCCCVAEVTADSNMPLDISVKVVSGLVEIYRFNIQLLFRSLKCAEQSKISFKRKQTSEIEVHVKNKRLKDNFETLNWDNLYCLDFDNELLTDEQIVQCLLTSKHKTSVQNIADITLREAPLSCVAYSTLDGLDDDFGPVTDTEMCQLFFPRATTDRAPLELVQCEQPTDTVGCVLDLLDGVEQHTDGNGPIADVTIAPLEDVQMEMVAIDPEAIPPLDADNVGQDEPTPSVARTESVTSLEQETANLVQSIIEPGEVPAGVMEKSQPNRSVANRPTKISTRCMELSFLNYWKFQRKRPKQELELCIAANSAENLLHKTLRNFRFTARFERLPKIKKADKVKNLKLLMRDFGLDGTKNRTATNSAPAVDTVATVVQPSSIVNQPIILPAHPEPEKRLSGAHGTDEPLPTNESYVSDNEMHSLLQSLWHSGPDTLPFDMVKSHIRNRFTAASVFAHLLVYSAKGIIRVMKGESGAPQTLIKGPNWECRTGASAF